MGAHYGVRGGRRWTVAAFGGAALLMSPAPAQGGADAPNCFDEGVVEYPMPDAIDVPLNAIITHAGSSTIWLLAEDGTQVLLQNFETTTAECARQQSSYPRSMRPSAPLEPNTRYESSDASAVRFTTGSTMDLEPPLITIGPDEDPGFGFRAQLYDAEDTILLVFRRGFSSIWSTTPIDGLVDFSSASFADGEAVVFTAYDQAGNSVVLDGESDAPVLTEQGCSIRRRGGTSSRTTAVLLALGAIAVGLRRRKAPPQPNKSRDALRSARSPSQA